MCVCMCVGTYVRLKLKKGHTSFSPEFGMFNALKKGRHFKMLILLKSVLGSNPSESGFCSSEIKSDSTTAPTPKLLSGTRLQ
jgi:hypothetical protein